MVSKPFSLFPCYLFPVPLFIMLFWLISHAQAAAFQAPEGTQVPWPLVSNFFKGPMTLAPLPTDAHAERCRKAPKFSGPVVLLTRDESSVFHVLRFQLMPLFLSLRAFGLHQEPFQASFSI